MKMHWAHIQGRVRACVADGTAEPKALWQQRQRGEGAKKWPVVLDREQGMKRVWRMQEPGHRDTGGAKCFWW